MTLNFITSNNGKFAEVKENLPGYNLQLIDTELTEIQGTSYEIILAKCQEAYYKKNIPGPFIVEDTSLTFTGLGKDSDLPGPYIKHFCKSLGNDGLYRLYKNFMGDDNNKLEAVASCLIGFCDYDGTITIFTGKVSGTICKPTDICNCWGFDNIFIPDGYNETFAKLGPMKKNMISHRKLCVDELKKFLDANKKFKKN